MSRRCEICGRTSTVGNRITRSGSPKYKGGIGLHTGGITKRRFYPNVQKIRVFVDGTVKRVRVCSRCLKAGKVQKPPARPNQIKASAEREARRVAEEVAAAEAARLAAEAAEAEALAEAEEEAHADETPARRAAPAAKPTTPDAAEPPADDKEK
ncbi:MAG TPA: 50S ribosomal protein L28 [Planctomycetota bacterium]|nr:50S ribosomal protein L28 [Planctomycetota bacterium]